MTKNSHVRDNALWGAANLAALLMGVFLGLALADASPADNWLNKWQTLVAGILAVFAAFVTVMQMRITDDRQQLRHDELIGLNLRADRLIVERAADRAVDDLRTAATRLPVLYDSIRKAIVNPPDDQTGLSELVEECANLIRLVHAAADSRLVEEAEPLFSAAMTRTRQELIALSNRPEITAPFLQAMGVPGLGIRYEPIEPILERTWSRVDPIPALAACFAEDLLNLAAKYR